MKAPPGPVTSKDVTRTHEQMRSLEGISPEDRESLLRRVLAARRRLPKAPSNGLARLR
ncbi:MAG TPA: hypothetical protein VNB59_02520 [Solirubrobacterales bacterium]|jgi:hypothetical protein|nr:hypothetical protein [Solirubrobacterales bacterium]